MSVITKDLNQAISLRSSTSLKNSAMESFTVTQLPGSIIKNISSFTPFHELSHNIRLVCKEWQQILPEDGILNLQNSPITDQELLDLISKYKKPLHFINLCNCKNITNKGLKYLSKLQSLTTLDISMCKHITDKGIKSLAKLPNLQSLKLRSCPITDAGAKALSKLPHLAALDLTMCDAITRRGYDYLFRSQSLKKLNEKNIKEFHSFKRISIEQAAIALFISEKCKKLSLPLYKPKFVAGLYGMQMRHSELEIHIDRLYLLVEKDIDLFLEQNPQHRNSIRVFLSQKNPHLLERAAIDLINWSMHTKGLGKLTLSKANKNTAAEILVMHALGNLSASKRFQLTHEIGHGYDSLWSGIKSLGSFDPRKLNFIKPHQFSEVRADLTGAREENLHKEAIVFFEWASILAEQPPATDVHPTDVNRARAIQMDYSQLLKTKLALRRTSSFTWSAKTP